MKLMIAFLIFLIMMGIINIYTLPGTRSFMDGFVGLGDSECPLTPESKTVTTVCHIPVCTKLESSFYNKGKWIVNCTCDCSNYTRFREADMSLKCLQIYAQFSPDDAYKPGVLCLCDGDVGCSNMLENHPEFHIAFDFLFLLGLILLLIYATFEVLGWGRSYILTCCGIEFQIP